MENFRKLVYKTPELQNVDKSEFNNETLEYSEKIAKEKLGKIFDPEFKDFGVRLMNIGEYTQIIKNEKIDAGSELYIQEGCSLTDYMKSIPDGDWVSTARSQTRWDHSNHNISTYNALLTKLKITRQQESKSSESKDENYIINVLKKFRNEIIKNVNEHDLFYSEAFPIIRYVQGNRKDKVLLELKDLLTDDQIREIISELETNVKANDKEKVNIYQILKRLNLLKETKTLSPFNEDQEIITLVKDLRDSVSEEKSFGYENIEIVKKFLNDDNFFVENKNNLRNLFNALSYQGYGGGNEERQYQVALILDKNITLDENNQSQNSWGSDIWKLTQKRVDNGAKDILAAIALIPNKELYQEMVEVEKNSGDFSHPIFDNRGNIKWPNEK